MRIDFKKINDELLSAALSLIPMWLPDGKRQGPEWVSKNPNRNDNTPGSFRVNVFKGVWKDFSNGDGGSDLISLYQYLNNTNAKDAADDLMKILGGPMPEPIKANRVGESPWIVSDKIAPREATQKEMNFDKFGALKNWWAYRDRENKIIGYVCRFEDEHGAKQTIPMAWCINKETGQERWMFKGFKEPRPLFNVASIYAHETSPILIVEGEKCAEKAAALIGSKVPVVTWPGGTNSVKKVDWTHLKNRTVYIWPDADEPGVKAAKEIARFAKKQDCTVKMLVPPSNVEKGWDCADLIEEQTPTSGEFWNFIQSNIYSPKRWLEKITGESARVENENAQTIIDDDYRDYGNENDADVEQEEQRTPPPKDGDWDGEPFRCLGHNRENFYYLPKNKGQITSLTASAHTKANLITLAMQYYWEQEFPGKHGPNWGIAAERLIWQNYKAGIFTPDKVRGRGAWLDGKDSVVHLGDRAIVNGEKIDPVNYTGRYIYERAHSFPSITEKCATREDGIRVLELCKMFPWKSDVMGVLAAGWAFLAPICGVLYWRPHIWITGEAGSGKTWFKDNVLSPFINGFGLMTQGDSTAAGVRQTLMKDALPVLFDEAESNDRKGAERIAGVLELMRQASMPGESAIFKGSAGGESNSYLINSMFALVSIVTAIKQQADEGRITLLELLPWGAEMEQSKGRGQREHFGLSASLCSEIFTPENTQKFKNRAFNNIPKIRRNIEIFREVCAEHFGNQRTGDQIGTLLAGAFCLAADGNVSRDQAKAWLNAQDWTEQTQQLSGERDHEAVLRTLLQKIFAIQLQSGRREFNVEQLIRASLMNAEGGPETSGEVWIPQRDARDALKRAGIRVSRFEYHDRHFTVEPRHAVLDSIFRDTPWATGYGKVLMRVKGATSEPRRIKTPGGDVITKRVIKIPAGFIVEEDFELEDERIKEMADDVGQRIL